MLHDTGIPRHSGEFATRLARLAAKSLAGERLSKEEVLGLLALPPESPEAELLGQTARRMAAEAAGNRGRVWSAIGVDSRPCPMNCGFCSFGEKWGLLTGEHELSDERILEIARVFVAEGAAWLTLRTTEFFSRERLLALVRLVRAEIPGPYEIVVNTGDLGPGDAKALLAAGVSVIYHALRLGEGCCTGFTPEERQATLASVRGSGLKLAHLVEPLGPEHTDEEIAEVLLGALDYQAALSGSMARVNVKGTPFGEREPVGDRRLAQVVAVTRLCGGKAAPDICVHPPVELALDWGANVVVAETGAVPRDGDECAGPWRAFGVRQARELLRSRGYEA